ncbi:MAG: ATP-binding protein [Desulfobulbaceae bacterium]|nr:ATP-binding protein [Desulfobulbaceae bacterium]
MLPGKVKYIFIICLVVAIGYPLVNIVFIFPAFSGLLTSNTEDEAVRLARHLSSLVVDQNHNLVSSEQVNEKVGRLSVPFGLEKLKVFNSKGTVIFSTDSADIGTLNTRSYFHGIVAKGDTYTKLVRKNQLTKEGRTVGSDVVETYVPIMADGRFVGAFEIYYDITERNDEMQRSVLLASVVPVVLMFVFLVIVTAILVKSDMGAGVPDKESGEVTRYQSPFYFLLIASLIIYASELMVMFVFFHGINRASLVEAIIDASLLVMITSPLLYFLLGRPLVLHIHQRREAERKLDAALHAAEDANRAKSEFLANMSHEIRTPMNGILGFTSILLASKLPDKERNFLDMIKSSGNRLMALINDILDLSKIEAGKLTLRDEPFRLRPAMTHYLRPHEVVAGEKGLRLHWHVADDVPDELVGDTGRLSQILTNLVGNSIKFTDSGEVEVRVELDEQLEKSALLHFSVHDTGIGVAEEQQEAIFETFTQEDGSRTRKYGGTGLGLAICRQLVVMMGGRIWMQNRVDEGKVAGAIFHFTLRLQTRDDSQSLNEIEAATVSIPAGVHILLAEDEYVSRVLAEEILVRQGIRVTSVVNGKEALAAIEAGGVDLLLTDLQMPGMDGLAAVAALREREKKSGAPRLPVIAMTAHAMAGDREKCLAADMDDYVSKPVQQVELFAAIAKQLSR